MTVEVVVTVAVFEDVGVIDGVFVLVLVDVMVTVLVIVGVGVCVLVKANVFVAVGVSGHRLGARDSRRVGDRRGGNARGPPLLELHDQLPIAVVALRDVHPDFDRKTGGAIERVGIAVDDRAAVHAGEAVRPERPAPRAQVGVVVGEGRARVEVVVPHHLVAELEETALLKVRKLRRRERVRDQLAHRGRLRDRHCSWTRSWRSTATQDRRFPGHRRSAWRRRRASRRPCSCRPRR